jgi:hypothetical protein
MYVLIPLVVIEPTFAFCATLFESVGIDEGWGKEQV